MEWSGEIVGCAITGLEMYSERTNVYSETCNVRNIDNQTAPFHEIQEAAYDNTLTAVRGGVRREA